MATKKKAGTRGAKKKTTSGAAGEIEDLEHKLKSTATQMRDCVARCERLEKEVEELRAWRSVARIAYGYLCNDEINKATPLGLEAEASAVDDALTEAGLSGFKASDAIRQLNRDIRATVVRSSEPVEVELGRKGPPSIFTDAPYSSDADANQSAPTIPMSMYDSLFPVTSRAAASSETLGDAPRDYPSWCTLAILSSYEDKEHGKLLTFMITDENKQRVVWVRS